MFLNIAEVAYPFVPWMPMLNVQSAAVALMGSEAIVVLYIWFVISIPQNPAYSLVRS